MSPAEQLKNFRIDADSSIPKFEQLQQILLEYIRSLPESVRYLPYENEIAATMNISRKTVRRALEELRLQGIIQTSKKSGSRILRNSSPAPQTPHPLIRNTKVAVILSSDQEGPGRSSSHRWQLIDAFESRVVAKGGGVIVHNLREDNWRQLNNLEGLADSLQEEGVHWALIYSFDKVLQPRFPQMLLKRKIKPVLINIDIAHVAQMSAYLPAGMDVLQFNPLAALWSALDENFSDVDAVGYILMDDPDQLEWAVPRSEVCRRFAAAAGVPFRVFRSAVTEVGGENVLRLQEGVVQEYFEFVQGCKKPLCVVSNDELAAQFLRIAQQQGRNIPEDSLLIGYDNSVNQRDCNLSTFDLNPVQISEMLESMYAEFLLNSQKSMEHSITRTTYPRYIARKTT